MDDRTDPTRPGQTSARYDRDLYTWAVEQAALLRAGRTAEADALNIAEELDDVGNEQYDKLESALRLILLHLLKWVINRSGVRTAGTAAFRSSVDMC